MLGDYHFHTHFSTDSEADPEEYIKKAILLNMNEICFTDHLDLDYPVDENGNEQFKLDAEAYYSSLFQLKEKYSGRLQIRIGVEMGMNHDFVKQNHDFINSKPFDFVIGSTHTIRYQDPYYPAFWEGRNPKEVIAEYYETCLHNVTDDNDYDVFGHLDYVRRYVPDKSYVYIENDFYDITEAILKNIISKEHGLELNTRGLHKGFTYFLPMIALLRRYRELGGEIVTVGSDAHKLEDFGYAFKIAAEILENTGFRYVTVYEERKPTFIPL